MSVFISCACDSLSKRFFRDSGGFSRTQKPSLGHTVWEVPSGERIKEEKDSELSSVFTKSRLHTEGVFFCGTAKAGETHPGSEKTF